MRIRNGAGRLPGLVVAGFVAILALPAPAGTQSVGFYGVSVHGDNVMFLVDVSGSMEGRDEGFQQGRSRARAGNLVSAGAERLLGRRAGSAVERIVESEGSKLGRARRELIRMIATVDRTSSISVASFGGPGVVEQFSFAGMSTRTRVQAGERVARLSASGGTPMRQAIEYAFANDRVDMIVLVSDGQPTDGAAQEILRRVRELNRARKVVIHTIGVGADQDQALMCALARENHGAYTRGGEVVRGCHSGVCDDGETVTFFNRNDRQYHNYHVSTAICPLSAPGCTADVVFRAMVSQARFIGPSPANPTAPVSDCVVTVLTIRPGGDDNEPIRTVVDPASRSITNYTKRNHTLHAGRVTRTVRVRSGTVYVDTNGEGVGILPRLNEWLSGLVWQPVDLGLATYVQMEVLAGSRRR